MSSKILKIITRICIIFILAVFLMGYNSERISKIFLHKVIIHSVRAEDIKTTINFKGTMKVKNVRNVRLPFDFHIDNCFVKDGDEVRIGDPLFSINDPQVIKSLDEEKKALQLKLKRLEIDYNLLTDNTKILQFQKIDIMRSNITNLGDQLKKLIILAENDMSYQDRVNQTKTQLENKQVVLDNYIFSCSVSSNKKEAEAIDLLSRIEIIENQIENLENKRLFYDYIDDDGVFRADRNGIVTDLNNMDSLIQSNDVVLKLNEIEDYSSYYYHGSFDKKNSNLIQNGDIVYLKVADNVENIKCIITKVYDIVGNEISIDAVVQEDSDYLFIGANYLAYSIETPASSISIPRSSIVSKNEIKTGSRVQFFVITSEEGLLGTEYKAILSYGTATYIGDELIGLSERTLPREVSTVIINPSSKINSGDKINPSR